MTPTPPKKASPTPAPTAPKLGPLAELANIQEQFNNADTKDSGAQLPDATYNMKVKEVGVDKANAGKFAGHLQVRFTWAVTEGPSINRTYREFPFALADSDKLGWFKGRIKALGYPSDTLAECDAACSQVVTDARVYQVRLKTKEGKDGGSFQSLYIDKCLESAVDDKVAEDLGAQLDEAGVEEAAEEPAVQHTAAKAPPVKKAGKATKAAPADAEVADLLSDLEG